MELSIILKAINGDHDAYSLLVKKHYAETYAIAMSIVGNQLDAEELTQEAFVKAYLNLSKLKKPERFSAWLHCIIRNLCRDWLRKQMQPDLPIDDLFNDRQLTFPSADENILKKEYNDALAESLSSLTYDDKKILMLYYVYGFDYEDIIHANGQSYSAVTSRLHKAKKKMKEAIKNQASPYMAEGVLKALAGGDGYMKTRLGRSQDVLDGIKTVEYAQSDESTRHFLNGIYLEQTKEYGLRMVATDGKRMAVAQLPENDDKEEISMVILRDDVNLLKETLQQEDADVSIEKIDESMTAFYIGDTKKLIRHEGKYPVYRDIVSREYTESITLERQAILNIMERIVDPSKEQSPSDWVQKGNVVYVSSADLFARQMIKNKTAELCHKLLEFITSSNSPEELGKSITDHLPKEEYQNLLNALEKQKEYIDPSKPLDLDQLNIIDSKGVREFVCRFNSRFVFKAVKSMKGDVVKIHYQMGDGTTIPSIATFYPVKLCDETDNIHIIMPMMV